MTKNDSETSMSDPKTKETDTKKRQRNSIDIPSSPNLQELLSDSSEPDQKRSKYNIETLELAIDLEEERVQKLRELSMRGKKYHEDRKTEKYAGPVDEDGEPCLPDDYKTISLPSPSLFEADPDQYLAISIDNQKIQHKQSLNALNQLHKDNEQMLKLLSELVKNSTK